VKMVPLHGEKAAGRFALVDDADYEMVMQYRWHAEAVKGSVTLYAQANITKPDGKHTTIRMHVLIAGYKPRTDHIDGDGLNNQRSNLRPATYRQNNHNMRARRPNVNSARHVSQYKGVTWKESGSRWRARIVIDGKEVGLGTFISELAAAQAYDAAAREAFGEYAKTNFPKTT